MQTQDDEFSTMSAEELQTHLQDADNKKNYMGKLASWEERRRSGKRHRSAAQSKVQTEQCQALETRECLGYLWTPAMLTKKGLPVPKKLTSISHGGKTVKGVLKEEWAVGCIEVLNTSSKSAKRIREKCFSESEEENDHASEAVFDSFQSKLKAKVQRGDNPEDEPMLKMPGKTSSMEEDLASILWGTGSASSRGPQPADSEDDEPGQPGSSARRVGSNKKRKSKDAPYTFHAPSQSPLASDVASNAGDVLAWGQLPAKATSKKKAAENKELEKSESAILAAQQLQASLENADTIMGVALNKTNQLLEKIQSRLSEEAVPQPSTLNPDDLGPFLLLVS